MKASFFCSAAIFAFAAASVCYGEWYVSAETGDDANDGLAATSAVKTIQAAIDRASSGETIHVAAGTYAPFDVGEKTLTIVGAGSKETIFDGGGLYAGFCATLSALQRSSLSSSNRGRILRHLTYIPCL